MKKALLFVLLFLLVIPIYSNELNKSKPDTWVYKIDYIRSDSIVEEDYQYLLVDYQYNLLKDEYYVHFIVKIINNLGVQNFSNLELEFNPSYEKLELNKLHIYRGGNFIDKYNSATISVVQRETDYEHAIYDGSKSALILLHDIREGDVLEYSYTLSGANPINKQYRSGLFYQEFDMHVNRIYNRLITNKAQELRLKDFNHAQSADTKIKGGEIEYIWDIHHSERKLSDANYPAWYDPYNRVTYSNYKDWGEVVEWALPLYQYNDEEIKPIVKELQANNEINSEIISVVRFVQNKIRYLGIEEGVNAYKPHSPKQVYHQRFGDCKDKSLLLIALLRSLGYESFPVMVNYSKTKGIINDLPSKSLFNHLVVNIKYKGKDFYIDATASNQGGDLDRIYFPDYAYGLIIRKGETQLTKLPEPSIPKINVHETFTMDSIGGGGFLHIKTVYSGSKADEIRNEFNSQAKSEISKAYLDFYSNLYPDIQILKPIEIKELSFETKNEFEVSEHYKIQKLWDKTEDSTTYYIEVYPLILENFLTYERTANRSMPFYCGEIIDFKQESQLIMPETWNVDFQTNEISHETFNYKNKSYSNDNEVFFNHSYLQREQSVEPSQIQSFFDKQEKITKDLSFYVLYTPVNENFSFSWLSLVIILFTGFIGFYIMRKLNNYDPKPKNDFQTINTIGGWLILPMIGLFISPFTLGYQIFSYGFLDQSIWVSALNFDPPQSLYMVFLILMELVFNILLMAFLFLVLNLFIKKRSSLPKIISVFYIINFLIPVIDLVAANLLGLVIEDDAYTQIIWTFLAMCIWVPYFLLSDRSKNTFVNRRLIKAIEFPPKEQIQHLNL